MSIGNRLIDHLSRYPQALKMTSTIEACGTVGCIAGLVCLLEDVPFEITAMGVHSIPEHALDEAWLEYEFERTGYGSRIWRGIPATARAIWADYHGVEAAELLPLYSQDWDIPLADLRAAHVIPRLQQLL